ncbi:MAG: hypothetical protein U9O94_03030 [Nanoarchaeota archaeon]|nr:hypothetical protein [Nanoarchaeota archaeon]
MIEYNDLLRKGYSKKEAQRTVDIIKKTKQKKSSLIKFLDSSAYWVLLAVALIGNLVISIILIPFLLTLRKIPLYIIIAVLAALFGFLFHQLIREIEFLESRHYLIAWIFIPIFAVISVYYAVLFTNNLLGSLKLSLAPNSPLIISVIYAFAFILPYTMRNLSKLPSRN